MSYRKVPEVVNATMKLGRLKKMTRKIRKKAGLPKKAKTPEKAPPGNGMVRPSKTLIIDSLTRRGLHLRRMKTNMLRTPGQALYEARSTPPWPEYTERLHLMTMPGEVRNKIFSYVLPIIIKAEGQTYRKMINLDTRSCAESNPIVPTVLHVCRQLRYEYGPWFCKNIDVLWTIPLTCDSSRLTQFTQFAASLGCPDYFLIAFVGNMNTSSMPCDKLGWNDKWAPSPKMCWGNLKQWALDVFDGVETRVISGEDTADGKLLIANEGKRYWAGMVVDDNAPFLMRILQEARLAKGISRRNFIRKLEQMWKAEGVKDSGDLLE